MSEPPARGSWAIVYNPTKLDDVDTVRAACDAIADDLGMPRPTWIETTAEDPGVSMTRQALDAGATLVCALGGDGTVRSVAGALAGSEASLGILPAGTGNLLARNLGIPLDDHDAALRVALGGHTRRVDVGYARAGAVSGVAQPGDAAEEPFVVMAGVGLDAEMITGANDTLKKHLSFLAYGISTARALWQNGFAATVTVDGVRARRSHARMVLVCNCPAVQGGVEVAAGGLVDDGQLDVVTLSPRGILGWAAAAVKLVTRDRRGHPAVLQRSGTTAAIDVNEPTDYEVDGDVLGQTTHLEFRIVPGELTVCVPQPDDAPA